MTLLPSRDEFAAQLHTSFRLQHESLGLLNLDLEDVSELRSSPRQQIFTILLHGPYEPVLPQRIYHLEHDQLAEMDLFLVPIARQEDGVRYEAVFNHLVKE